MKKIISALLVVLILFNFILGSKVYAVDFEGTDSIDQNSISAKDQESLVNSGKVENKSSSGGGGFLDIAWTALGAIFGTIAGILALVINIFPMLIQAVMTVMSGSNGFYTIEDTVFNKIDLFNINFLQIGQSGSEEINSLRESVAKFFIITRLIAIALSLLVLIYVGIRMALSTLAGDKAKYKKMLIGWLESIIILFLMQYIIAAVLNLGEMFTNMLGNIKLALDSNGEIGFEDDIMNTMYSFMLGNAGWKYVAYSLVFWFLVFIQSKFFLSYFKRVITVGFLILIAPLVTITYPIDKIGDGKAQAFTVWFTELAMNIFIQPIHAIIYLVFMYTAGEIAKYSILIALLFLLSLTKVEKMILYLFNLKNVTSLRPVDEERKKGK